MIYIQTYCFGAPDSARDAILLCGSPQPATSFFPLAGALAPHCRVTIVEAPGNGLSPPVHGPYTMLDVAQAITGRLPAMAHPPAVLGFSLGSYLAFLLALRGDFPIGRLAVAAPLAGLSPEAAAQYRGLAGMLPGMPCESVRQMLLRRWFPPEVQEAHPEWPKAAAAWLNDLAPAHLAGEIEALAASPHLAGRLHEITCPVRLRAGTRDQAAPLTDVIAMAGAIPRAQLETVAGGGHLQLIEDAPGFQRWAAQALLGGGA